MQVQISSIMQPKYKRVLLKLSGEALLGNERNGDPFNPKIIEQYANEIKEIVLERLK